MAKRQTRTFTIEKAIRGATPVYGGIAGSSGSGKTYSALEVATGIQEVVGGDIGLIDTENRRALMYADYFQFRHIPFAPPFNALSYLDGLRFAKAKGVKVLVVDSMSHEHEGAGGHLEMHEAELDRLAGDDWAKRERVKMLAWAKPAAERRHFLLELQQTDMHVICCFRAKDKVAMVKQNGKTEVVSIGWQPIAGPEYVYDMKFLAMLRPNSLGVPDWDAEAAKIAKGLDVLFPKGKQLDRAVGKRLAQYLGGGKAAPAAEKTAADRTPRSDDRPPPDMTDDISWKPKDGWPTFERRSEWVAWSVDFLKKANREKAEAWLTRWSADNNILTDMAKERGGASKKARDDIDAAHKAAMGRS